MKCLQVGVLLTAVMMAVGGSTITAVGAGAVGAGAVGAGAVGAAERKTENSSSVPADACSRPCSCRDVPRCEQHTFDKNVLQDPPNLYRNNSNSGTAVTLQWGRGTASCQSSQIEPSTFWQDESKRTGGSSGGSSSGACCGSRGGGCSPAGTKCLCKTAVQHDAQVAAMEGMMVLDRKCRQSHDGGTALFEST